MDTGCPKRKIIKYCAITQLKTTFKGAVQVLISTTSTWHLNRQLINSLTVSIFHDRCTRKHTFGLLESIDQR